MSSSPAVTSRKSTLSSREVGSARHFVWYSRWLGAGGRPGAVGPDGSRRRTVRTYTLLRENEDWSFLKDRSERQDFWDRIKYIPLGADGWYLTIGGEVREAFEKVGNDNWGKQPYTNSFFLQRYMVHTDWHLGEHFPRIMQLKSGLEAFPRGGPRPIDEKKLDFEAAFFESRRRRKELGLLCEPAGRS